MPRFIIVGAGDFSAKDMPAELLEDDYICAADAGYLALCSIGVAPDLIIGDFDSMPEPTTTDIEKIKLAVVKDDTDISFCIKEGIRRGYKDFLILGALGGKRLSHTFANIQLLSMLRDMGGNGMIQSSGTRLWLLKASESLTIAGEDGDLLSIYSLSDESEVSLQGLYYPLDHGIITRGFPLGVSNQFTSADAIATVHSGEALIIAEKQ